MRTHPIPVSGYRSSSAGTPIAIDEKDRRLMEDSNARAEARFDICPGALVVGTDGELGRVERVVVGADAGLLGLIVRESLPLHRDVVIPSSVVEGGAPDLVLLRLSAHDLDEYRDDDQITDAVRDVLWYRSDIPERELRYVNIQTTDGIVDLSGYSSTERGRQAIVRITRGVRSVLGVRDNIRSLEALSEAARPFEHVRAPGQHRVGPE